MSYLDDLHKPPQLMPYQVKAAVEHLEERKLI